MTKILGKIDYAEFGTIDSYPFLMGLYLGFQLSNGYSITDGGKYTVNISNTRAWYSETERIEAVAEILLSVKDILSDAKVNKVSQLVGKFVDFRIFTEVL